MQIQSAFKFDGAADAKIGVVPQVSSSKPFISQTIPVNPQSVHQNFQSMNLAQAPLLKHTHSDISKIVQKFLHPQTSERPDWTPPSRDYMNKPLTCQVCKLVMNDVDSVLICDACEKGFHLKCLQINNPKGVPRAEWHCGKCLQLSNGKPLPPKYGRVMRNMNAPKAPSNTTSLQSSSEKKAGSLNENVNQQKITANGNTSLHTVATSSLVNSHPTSVSKMASASEMLGNTIAGRGRIDEKSSLGACSSEVTETSMPTVSHSMPPVKRKYEEMQLESEHPSGNTEGARSVSVLSQSVGKQDGSHQARLPNNVVLAKHYPDNHTKHYSLKESCAGEGLCNKTLESSRGDQEPDRANPSEASTMGAGHVEPQRLLQHHVHSVDWIGNIVRADDDKTFFHSCRINGFVYKLQDHVLIRFNNDRLIPSKLQVSNPWVSMALFF